MGEKGVIKRRGLAKKHAALDYEIWQWKTSLEKTRGTSRVSKCEVQAHALETYKQGGVTNFKASDGWYRRWRQRWQSSNLVLSSSAERKVQQNKVKNSAETSEVENIVELQQDLSQKDTCAENMSLNTKYVTESTKDCDITVGNTFDKGEIQLEDGYTSLVNTTETHRNAEEAAVNGQVQRAATTSSSETVLVNVNVVTVKQGKGKQKTLKLNHSNVGPLLKAHSTCNVVTSSIKDYSSETNMQDKFQQTESLRSKIIANPFNDSQNVIVENSIEQTIFLEDEYINQDFMEKTIRLLETTVEQNLGNYVNKEQSIVSSMSASLSSSQTESGISLPSSSSQAASKSSFILSPVFEQDGLDFSENEHELFCDSCEDFHPRLKCSHMSCKQKEEAGNSFLLNCVFENKEPFSDPDSSRSTKCGKSLNFSSDSSVPQLENPSVTAPKGKRYLVQFKSKVISHALNHSVKVAAEKFKVNRNTISEWLTEQNRSSTSVPVKLIDKDAAGDSTFLVWLEHSKFNLTNELVKQKTAEWLQANTLNTCRRSQWLWMYAHRLNGTEDVAVKKRYILYPEAFKRAVVFHAQTHSNIAASRVFGVARKRVIEWQQLTSDDKKTSKYTKASNVTDEAVDVQVYKWFCQQQPSPNSRQVRNKAVELYRAAGHGGIQCKAQWYYRWRARHGLPPPRQQLDTDLTPLLVWTLSQLDNNKRVSQSALAAQAALLGHKKVSRGWTFRFCKKYSPLLQALPAFDVPLPSLLEQQIREYKQRLRDIINSRGVTEDQIIALDEIPLHFLPKDKSKKPLLVRRPGFETCQASLMVSCLADGTLLPTIFVFKGEGPETNSSTDSRVIAHVNDTGRVSDDLMLKWLADVCFPRGPGGVIVVDSFDVHSTLAVSESVSARDIHLAVIPPGCAFRLLPITPFCHTFKAMLEDLCHSWLSRQTAVLESPSPDLLYQWALRAHKHVAKHCKEKIQLAFKDMLMSQLSQDNQSLSEI